MKCLTLVVAAFIIGCSPPSRETGGASTSAIAAETTLSSGGAMGGRMGSMSMMGRVHADTSAAPRPAAAQAAATVDCPPVDQALTNRGRTVFSGAGNCFACHGANAKGTPLAPDLTDAQWLNIDGSYAAIAGLVRTGVPNPKQHSAPMPPMGGGTLSAAQVCAVAAYVYSLAHR
ncbi:MAG: c-type cytochrome [Gemmatimonadota bacterium]